MKYAKWMLNEAKDGYKPVCPDCHLAVPDGEIADAKNYPEDGLVTVFFECPNCREEFQGLYMPYKPDKYEGIVESAKTEEIFA